MPPSNKIITVDDEKRIIELYIDGLSAPKILKELNNKFKTKKTVYDTLQKYGIKCRDFSDYNKVDHNYFSNIDNPRKAYVLGLMITDGWVNENKNCIGIQLQEKDKYIIEMIKKEWNSQEKILFIDRENLQRFKNSSNMYRICAYSRKIVEDLRKFGVVQRKSLRTILPIIDDHYMYDMIRGILDGDGCIFTHSNGKNIGIKFTGSHYLMAQLSMFLYTNNKQKITYSIPINRNTYSNVEWINPKDVSRIARKIYKNKENNYFLTRKYERIKHLIG